MTDTYKNGPGNVPRLPDRVVDTLIDSARVSCLSVKFGRMADQTEEVRQLVHDTCEELLARLPAPDEDGQRFRFMLAAATDPDSLPGRAMERFAGEVSDDDPRPHTEVMIEVVDKARAWAAEQEEA